MPPDVQLDLISQTLEAFDRRLSEERPANLAGVIAARVALIRAANAFMAHEGAKLAGEMRCGRVSDRASADLYAAFVALRADYSRHVGEWDSARLVREWPAYRAACRTLIVAMRRLLRIRRATGLPYAA